MTIRNRVIYAPQGLLAIAPQAYGMAYDVGPMAADGQPVSWVARNGEIEVISVRGPLMQHPDGCFRSYNEIQCDVETSLARRPKAVVLAISSPGGLVTGCFELAANLQAMAAASGVPIIAYVDGQACSAAYALACGCSRIIAPATSDVGSIGVIAVLADATAQISAMGMRFAVISSGKRKADGNPMTELTTDAVSAKQAHVDELAGMFFEHVAKARGISAAAVQALEAGTFTGAKAVRLHLVDEVQNLDQLLATLNAPASATQQATAAEEKPMSVKATLQAVIDDEKASDEDKEDAKKALAALGDDDGDKAKDGDDDADDDKPADDKASAAADDDEDDKPADDKAAAPAAAAVASTADARLAALEATVAQGQENAKRKRLMAARPDLTKEQRKALAAVPVSALAVALAAFPAPKVKAGLTQAAVAAVQAGTATETPAPKFDAKRAEQRRRMGLAASTEVAAIRVENDKFIFSPAALAQSKSGKAVAQ